MSIAKHALTATVLPLGLTVPPYQVERPFSTVGLPLSTFTTASFTNSNGSDATGATYTVPASGDAELRTTGGTVSGNPIATVTGTVSGLVAGRSYRAEVGLRRATGVATEVRVTFGGSTNGWFSLPEVPGSSYVFAAGFLTSPGASMSLSVETRTTAGSTSTFAGVNVWKLALSNLAYTETITPPPGSSPIPLDVIDGSLTLDASRWPFASATLQCHAPADPAILEKIDPRHGIRTTLAFSADYVGPRPDVTRTASMLLRSRTIDDRTGTMTVTLASDEMALDDMALISQTPERVFGLSVKTAVDFALAKIGKTLAPGWADANIVTDALPPVATNLHPNGSFSSSTTSTPGWVVGGSVAAGSTTSVNTTDLSSPVQSPNGRFWRVNFGGASSGGPFHNTGVSGVVAGERYRLTAWLRSNVAAKIAPNVEWYNGATNLGSTIGSTATLIPNVWTRVSHVHTAPASSTRAAPYWYATDGFTYSSGTRVDIDGVVFSLGDLDVDFFEGSTASTPLVTHAWTGTAYASSSTRTYLPNSDAMILSPGENLWGYLEPLLDSAGLRLWCDELGLWRMRPRDEMTDGQVTVSPLNGLIESANRIDRDGDMWFDSVVIKYADGVFDIAGTGGKKTLVLDRSSRTIPAFGGAQAILATALGRGRSHSLAASSNYAAIPSQQLVLSVPGQIPAVGVLQSVEWAFPAGTMNVTTRGIVETPATAWLFAPAGRRWDDIALGIDWTEYTP